MKPLSILVLLAFLSCREPGKKDIDYTHAYTFTGRIAGLDEGLAFLLHRGNGNKIDTAEIRDGVFVFTGRADTPEYCRLGFLNNGNMDFCCNFFLQNGKLEMTAKPDSLRDDAVMITGSPAEDEFRSVRRQLAIIGDMDQQQKTFIKQFVYAHPSSYVAAFEIQQAFGVNPDAKEIDSLYNRLDTAVRVSYYGSLIKDILDKAKLTDIGQPAPDFTQTDTAGSDVRLSSFKGKYILVDFWASWCGPCRRENPAVVKAWQRFHPKGFDILGVSLDNNREKWLEAIKKDQLPWTHVTDLNGWQNSAARLYGVRGIPMNYLLDKKGKIIAKNLRGQALVEKLAALLN
ncbi:MAG: AhpC/TSA family protein [Chitinophagaceae bacterium]|nr:AhpC/TSA family protein [Chitinophagaceae bacterium]